MADTTNKHQGKYVFITVNDENFRLHNLPDQVPYFSEESRQIKSKDLNWNRLYEAMQGFVEEQPEFKHTDRYRLFLKKWPLHEQARLIIVNQQTREWDKAERLCRDIIALDPAEPLAYYHLGFILRRMERYQESEQAYLKAIELMPDYGNLYANLGRTYEAWDKRDKAIQAWSKALELMPGDAPSFEALERLGLYVSVYTDIKKPETRVWLKREDYEEVLLGKYEELKNNAEQLTRWARSLLDDGRFEVALKSLQRAAALKPVDPEIWLLLAATYHQMERPDEGLQAVARHLALDPKSGYGYTYQAKLLASLGKEQEAMPVLKQALELDPNQENALHWYYLAMKEKGREQDGRRFLEELGTRFPDAYEPYAVLAGHYEELDLERSISWLRIAYQRTPDNIGLAAHYAGLLGKAGRVSEAVEVLEPFRPRFAEDWRMAWNLGQAYFHAGRPEQAIRFYRQVMKDVNVLPEFREDMRKQITVWEGKVLTRAKRFESPVYLHLSGGDMLWLAGAGDRLPHQHEVKLSLGALKQPVELHLLQGDGPTPEENQLLKQYTLGNTPSTGMLQFKFAVDQRGQFSVSAFDEAGQPLNLQAKASKQSGSKE